MATRRGVLAGASAPFAATVSRSLPGFEASGTYLDAAFSHPLGSFAAAAARSYTSARQSDPRSVGPAHNARRGAVAQFAALVGVAPESIAVVQSTLAGENAVVRGLEIGPDAGVCTDALHYDGSLALYAHLARHGTPVTTVRPRGGRIDLADFERAITPATRLVAVSLVSSVNGFVHDLPALCSLAHRKGALVYADIIQAAGAMDLDLAASGVDFACAATYKWLMGEFGCAFLYVRPDRLERLARSEVGWRQVTAGQSHVLPFDPPGPATGTYELGQGTAQRIEVGTPAWQALAVAEVSIAWLRETGVSRLAANRNLLLRRLGEGLAGTEWKPLTPGAQIAPGSPLAVYSRRGAAGLVDKRLADEGIVISTYENHIRVSPSLYNEPDDIDRLLRVLRRT